MAVKPWNPWVHRTLLTLCVVLGAVAVREYWWEPSSDITVYAVSGSKTSIAFSSITKTDGAVCYAKDIEHVMGITTITMPMQCKSIGGRGMWFFSPDFPTYQPHPQVLFTSTSKRHTPKPCLEGQYWNSQYNEVRWECH